MYFTMSLDILVVKVQLLDVSSHVKSNTLVNGNICHKKNFAMKLVLF